MANYPLINDFSNLGQDVLDSKLVEADTLEINAAIDTALATQTDSTNTFLSIFADAVTDRNERYLSFGSSMSQPLDEFGRALPTNPPVFQDVAYPLFKTSDALGLTFEKRAKMTVKQLNDIVYSLSLSDSKRMGESIVRALMLKDGQSFQDAEFGALAVKGLANGDSDVYSSELGDGDNVNHYLTQVDPISDTNNPFQSDRDKLEERSENGNGNVVSFVSSDLVSEIENLSDFKPVLDSNVQAGLGESVLTGQIGIPHPGTLIGYVNGVFIVKWNRVPTKTLITLATGGDRALGFRQDPTPSLQGYFRVAERNDFPYYESHFMRMSGFAARNRVNALVRRVGFATYENPFVR